MRRCFLVLPLLLLFMLPTGTRAQFQVVVDSVDATGFPTLRLAVRVLNGTSPVRNLTVGQFTVFEDGALRQPVRGYCADTLARGPVSVLLVMDVSRSMGPWPWGNNAIIDAKRAAVDFVNRLSNNDEAALLSFSDDIYYNQAWTQDFDLLKQRINALSVIGGTSLWDGVNVGANIIRNRANTRVMIVLTDGRDTQSGVTSATAINNARSAGTRVYTIGIGDDVDTPELENLARSTNGQYYHAPSASDLDNIYNDISLEISSTGFCELEYDSPLDCLNGSLVNIEVQVNVEGRLVTGSAQYQLPYDTTTFSYVNLAMDRDYVVEAGETISVPVELHRVTAMRAPKVFQFDMGYDTGLLTLESVQLSALTAGYRVNTAVIPSGSRILLQGDSAITTEGVLARFVFRAAHLFSSGKTNVSITPPEVQQFCTVATANDGLVTVSGSCERALQGSGSGTAQKPILRVHPNPLTSDARAEINIPLESAVTLALYNSVGTETTTFYSGVLPAGHHFLPIATGQIPSGVYFLHLEYNGKSIVQRVIIEK